MKTTIEQKAAEVQYLIKKRIIDGKIEFVGVEPSAILIKVDSLLFSFGLVHEYETFAEHSTSSFMELNFSPDEKKKAFLTLQRLEQEHKKEGIKKEIENLTNRLKTLN